MAATQTANTNLFLLEDLDDETRIGELAARDLNALRAVADWIKTYVARPNKGIGRSGTVCPFVPGLLESKRLWLASEQIADRGEHDVVALIDGYRRLLMSTPPTESDKVVVVVFPDLPADRAKGVFDGVLEQLAVPSFTEEGLLLGPYYEGNETTALYNSSFRPFESPVPFLFVRTGVVSDWKFFLSDDEWLRRWADRYQASGAVALAEELRRLPWTARRD